MSIGRTVTTALALALLVLGAGCRARLVPEAPTAERPLVRLAKAPAIADDGDRAALATAVARSVAYYATRPAGETMAFGDERITVAAMRDALAGLESLLAEAPSDARLAEEIARRFVAYAAARPGGGRFTGYYVPTLEARLARDAEFRFPILARPPDLVTVDPADFPDVVPCHTPLVGRVREGRLAPYFTRAEIEGGAAPEAAVLAWAGDPVDLFFLQIQGSGTLLLPGDERRTIGFAATNGHPYVSIGTLLVERGALPPGQASQAQIRDWVTQHPEERDAVLHANPRYVFFRPMSGPPEGSLGVPVTAGRTIATDADLYPRGALAFIRLPAGEGTGAPGLARLVLNQDAGGAIRGPGRVDLFFGAGDEAGAAAGRFKAAGDLYFLAPRPAAAR